MLKEGDDIIQGTIVQITFEFRQNDDVVWLVRRCLLSKVDIDDLFDRPAQVREILDVFAILHNGALTSQMSCKHLHAGIECHGNLFDKAALLVTEEH